MVGLTVARLEVGRSCREEQRGDMDSTLQAGGRHVQVCSCDRSVELLRRRKHYGL